MRNKFSDKLFKRRILLLLVLCATGSCAAQTRTISDRHLVWVGMFGQYNFSPALNLNLDAQARYEYTDGDWFTWLVRPGLTWKIKRDILLTAGVAYFKLYQNPNVLPPRPEWRIWQEVGKRFNKNAHTFYPRLRFEQRFIRQYGIPVFEEEFSFNTYRTRLRFDYTYKFSANDPQGFLLLAGNEYMFSTNTKGKSAFDQNRAYAGVGYRLSKNLNFQLTYLNLFLRKGGNQFDQHHIIRFIVVFQISKKEKEKENP
ncbi:MAG: DUF2490 domain-containing protein [Bacteroidota bacterium]|nr:DUF2490 domain-containing protein [Bacteroidota bacterium]